jgi:signal transduction histidine kinase
MNLQQRAATTVSWLVGGTRTLARRVPVVLRRGRAPSPNRKEWVLGGLAHEIQNELAAMEVAVATLESLPAPTTLAGAATELSIVRTSVDALHELVAPVLAGTDFDWVPTVDQVDVVPVVQGVLQRLSLLLADREVTVDAPAVVAVAADPLAVRVIVGNLLHNVVRHTPDGTRVSVTVVEQDDCVTVAVDDDGPGVAADVKPRLFSPDARREDGHGVGLFLCRAAARALRGELDYHDRAGGGARFALTLPAWGRPALAVVPPGCSRL